MKIVILYRPNSEHGRVVEDFVRDYGLRYGPTNFEVLNVDSKEGDDMAKLYDVMQYPVLFALRDDGQLLRSWEGDTLPLMDEVAAYAFA